MKEKTIYISNDGLKFESKQNCEEYENDLLSRLQYDIDTWYKPRKITKVPYNYPDLDYIKHEWNGIKQVIVDLTTLANLFWITHESSFSKHDNNIKLTKILNYIKLFDESNDNESKKNIQDMLLLDLNYILKNVYFEEKHLYGHLITDRIYNRLKNTDFITGYEYPDSKWIGRHNEFIKYREEELNYQKEGGTYR